MLGDGEKLAAVKSKTIKEMAREELEKELVGEQKEKLKRKLKEKYLAEQVVKNLNREIEDLELEISHKLEGI
jgi:ATP-dependent Lon protease